MRVVFFSGFTAVGISLSVMGQTSILNNGDFEQASLLGPGQTEVALGDQKILFQDSNIPDYVNGISGIPSWMNSFTDVGFGPGFRDAGIRYAEFGGAPASRFAFINNWDTRLSQPTGIVIEPGWDLILTLSVGSPGTSKGGRVQLWAGEPLAANPDQFPASALMLTEATLGTTDWTPFTPDVILAPDAWTQVTVEVHVPVGSPAIGQPLTVSLLTSGGSAGPLYFDNVSLVPEPLSLGVVAPLLLAYRRRSS